MKPDTSASLKLIAFGLFLIFLIFLGLSVPFYLRQRDVLKNWIVTDGTVRDSEVVSVPAKRGTNYDAHIVVVYRIGDSIRTSLITTGYASSRRSHAQSWVDRYPAGSHVTIAYNPLDYGQVRLDPGYNRYFFAAPLMVTQVGAGFGFVGLIFFLIARNADRRNQAETGKRV